MMQNFIPDPNAPLPPIYLQVDDEPETIQEARAASKIFQEARKMGLNTTQQISTTKQEALNLYIELLSTLIYMPTTDPRKPALKQKYHEAKRVYHLLGGGTPATRSQHTKLYQDPELEQDAQDL